IQESGPKRSMSRPAVASRSRCVSFSARAIPGLPLLPDHEDPVELDDGLGALIEAARTNPHEAETGSTPGFADLGHLGLRIDRISVEDGAGETDVLEPDLESVPARPVDEEARRDRDGQEAIHDPSTAEGFPGEGPPRVVFVEVDLVRVSGEEGEPHVVRLGHCPPDLSPDLRSDPEVLKKGPVVHRNSRCERVLKT